MIEFLSRNRVMQKIFPTCLSKSSTDDYVIQGDITGYPDTATDSSRPFEQFGIISFNQSWHQKFGESLARVPLMELRL